MAEETPSYAIGRIVEELTRGRPYVFVIMPYGKKWAFFEHVQRTVEQTVGLACIRADNVPGAGHDLLAKIHLLIERAELIIAEVSTHSPNVFYEVGYAVAAQKSLLLLVEHGIEVPTDLKGREVIEYDESQPGMAVFDKRLRDHLRLRVNSQVSLLRDMLEADVPQPAYIIASPRHPAPTSPFGQHFFQRTFGDYLGILGLVSAFGSFMGEGTGVELIPAQFCVPKLWQQRISLYLIGSPRSNPAVHTMLERLQKGREPSWHFGPLPGQAELQDGDYERALYRIRSGQKLRVEGISEMSASLQAEIHRVDHGIIVRGPHPDHPERLVMIMAGPHSVGTGAACLAATRSPLIQQIRALLPPGTDIADKRRALWALVRGELDPSDYLLHVEGVRVLEAGVWGT